MQAKPYPEAKRRILIKRDQIDFIAFLKEITDQTGKHFVRERLLQNQVPGFRPGRAPLKRTVPILISKLKNESELTNCDSSIWNSFTNAWMYWIKSHPELEDVLTSFDNGTDFDADNECITPPNSELDIECFKFLLEASHNAPIHQETIRRFYEYGYFNEDEQIQNLVNQVASYKEIEQREQLAELPDKVSALLQTVDRLSENINNLNSRVSALESAEKLEQKFARQIAAERESFDLKLQKLEKRVLEKHELLNTRLSERKSNPTQLVGLTKRINSLESRFSEINKSINSFAGKLLEIESTSRQQISKLVSQRVKNEIKQLNSRVVGKIEFLEQGFDDIKSTIADIQSEITNRSKISVQVLEIGESYKSELSKKTERYEDENEYLDDFRHCLRRFGVTDSEDEEMAAAIHIALKAFPAIEITDARIIKTWRLMCDNHFYNTTINVEMGWLGLQDWFPDFFAQRCFGERLEQVDLEASIRKMRELGDMSWVIHLRDCDRSFPDSYLPSFLDWVGELCEGGIRVFLSRCFGTNRCDINENFYERVARLPKPKTREPVESRNLRPSGIPLTFSEWESWCCPNPDLDSQYNRYYDFLEDLRSIFENRGVEIPIGLLREIQHYLQLSHNIMAGHRAFDWALIMRLLPWIGNRHRLIDAVLNLVNGGNEELPHFQEELRIVREVD